MAASFKLGSLLLKTLSKPLANSFKRRAHQSESFESFCVGLAQGYNQIETKMKQRFLDYKSEPVKPLSAPTAVAFGANFLSEIIIFTVGAATILAEQIRSSQSEKKKREIIKADIRALESSLETAIFKSEQRDLTIQQLKSENLKMTEELEQIHRQLDLLDLQLHVNTGSSPSNAHTSGEEANYHSI